MLRRILLITFVIVPAIFTTLSNAQETTGSSKKVLVIRQAKEDSSAAVAVEGFLEGDVFSAKVTVRIEEATPDISSILLVGPNIGRMGPTSIKSLYATTEVEEPYQTTTVGGFVSFGDQTKSRQLKGRVTRKLAEYRIPAGQIEPNGEYQLWVRRENQSQNGRVDTYRFDLTELPRCANSK